jgi:hypothetical protein
MGGSATRNSPAVPESPDSPGDGRPIEPRGAGYRGNHRARARATISRPLDGVIPGKEVIMSGPGKWEPRETLRGNPRVVACY